MDGKTSIGAEVWGNHIYLLNEEDDEIKTENAEGKLAVRGRNIMASYYLETSLTEQAFKNDYFQTGDIVYFRIIQGQKFYYLSGRKKEIAKIQGRLIYLNEIDELLISNLPYISQACSVCYFNKNQEEQLGFF
jgi:long-chain acyl-CoA synthetase